MTLTDRLYSLGAAHASKPSWPHGTVAAAFMFDFRAYGFSREYNFLRAVYPNYVDIFEENVGGRLAYLGENDKLILICYSALDGFLGDTYRGMTEEIQCSFIAKKLRYLGLSNIGVIKLHASYIGYSKFLDVLREQLILNGINFSYLSGPKANYTHTPFNRNFVSNTLLDIFDFPKTQDQYKILQGNLTKSFVGTRYQGNDDPDSPGFVITRL
ncbi:hypothetical protein WKW50_24570 [Ochrobactrum sp. GPK 3]|uniref:hypothetical protein n=1 Tax=Brucella sp. 22210 TaxID=3453892 RepID=UPI0031385B06